MQKKKCYAAQLLSFTYKLSSLFDIVASNAEGLIRKDTSRYINSQISFLGPLDKSYTMKVKRKEQKEANRK